MTQEMVVFLPKLPDVAPIETARALVDMLDVARAYVGEDLLTGAVTVRTAFDPILQHTAQTFLAERGVPHEITLG